MKKILFSMTVLILLLCAGIALSATTAQMWGVSAAKPYTSPMIMSVSTTLTTGAPGISTPSAFSIPVPSGNISCTVTFTGTSLGSDTISLDGSTDGGANWVSLTTTTSTSNTRIDVTGKIVNQIRMNWTAISKGAGTTVATFACVAQQ